MKSGKARPKLRFVYGIYARYKVVFTFLGSPELRRSGGLHRAKKSETNLLIKAHSSRVSVCHVIPVKKRKENDFSMESSDSSEGFHRIMSIFGERLSTRHLRHFSRP